jgi:hypothetical protein
VTSHETSDSKQKICEACGQPFACSASEAACWCEQVSLGVEARAELGAKFSDCLCPTCLNAAARGEPV